ncbi:MAG: phosphatidic acid phosphatase [Oscillospiraceae bacterium]|nr:phosphatidic acid phosphatase [Oscillospiraceae bacterium]
MKQPAVDYRAFRLSKLHDPQYSHLKLLFGWVGYFILYFLTENLIPAERCTPVHMWLDDVIPFCEWFVIPYVFWYVLIVLSLGYFLLYDVDSFRRLQTYIIITQIVAVTVYILFPSRQDLRPTVFPRDNFLTDCVALLYRLDTNTGVCPSLHVAYSMGIASVWLKKKDASRWCKAAVTVAVILICLSTMMIKQHSAVDFFAALPVCLLAEGIVYKDRYRISLRRKRR